MEHTDSTVMTAREVADELRCSVALVYKLASSGDLRVLRLSTSPRPALRFLASDVLRFLEEAQGIERAELRRPDVVTR